MDANIRLGRRYLLSSSFKMAMLFTICLSISLVLLIYILVAYYQELNQQPALKYMIIFSMLLMIAVIVISYGISIYVVRRINHISTTAIQIMRTGDLTRRIEVEANWDDLSNLSHVLNGLFDKVDSLLQSVRQVADNVAHDLKTPLTRLHHQIATLHDNHPTDETERALRNTQQILDTFHALLRISSIEHGRQSLHKSKVNMQTLLADALELYEPVYQEKNITFTFSAEPTRILADKDLIFQAIANIIDNAIKFTPENGRISLYGCKDATRYIIEIADNGCGVTAGAMPKIFNRFYREDGTRHVQGHGLGLSLVFAIIDKHNGSIVACANEPKGLKMRITLPIQSIM